MSTNIDRPTVYVVQDDRRKNLTPALDFGDVEVLLNADDQVMFNQDYATKRMYSRLRDFTPDDFILCVGDPVAIGMACAIAALRTGGAVKCLKWDRHQGRYFEVKFDVSFVTRN